jgi:N-glycosylase/DNA lyase
MKQCFHGCFEVPIDFAKTIKVYNLCYWVENSKAYIFLDPGSVAVVDSKGCYKIYSENCSDELVNRLRWILGVDLDVSEFFAIAKQDPILKGFAEEFVGWRPRATDLWWALLVAHCQRAASFRQGWGVLHRIVYNYGLYVEIDGRKIPRPPSPEEVLREPEKLLRSGVGFRAEGILRSAEAIMNGLLDPAKLGSLPDDKLEEELLKLPHVGSYVARLVMILAFRRYSLPPVDRWVVALASKAYGLEAKQSVVDSFLRRRWGRWAGLAVYAMTIALDAEPLSRALRRVEEGAIKPLANLSPTPLNMKPFCEER